MRACGCDCVACYVSSIRPPQSAQPTHVSLCCTLWGMRVWEYGGQRSNNLWHWCSNRQVTSKCTSVTICIACLLASKSFRWNHGGSYSKCCGARQHTFANLSLWHLITELDNVISQSCICERAWLLVGVLGFCQQVLNTFIQYIIHNCVCMIRQSWVNIEHVTMCDLDIIYDTQSIFEWCHHEEYVT